MKRVASETVVQDTNRHEQLLISYLFPAGFS